eukprot:5028879-Prymnesium_polylepis.1
MRCVCARPVSAHVQRTKSSHGKSNYLRRDYATCIVSGGQHDLLKREAEEGVGPAAAAPLAVEEALIGQLLYLGLRQRGLCRGARGAQLWRHVVARAAVPQLLKDDLVMHGLDDALLARPAQPIPKVHVGVTVVAHEVLVAASGVP